MADDIDKQLSERLKTLTDDDIKKLSDSELDTLLKFKQEQSQIAESALPQESMGSKVASYITTPIIKAGKAIESVTGAPTRAGIKGFAEGGLLKGVGAFASQFGAPVEQAPTGEQVALSLGASDKPVREGLDQEKYIRSLKNQISKTMFVPPEAVTDQMVKQRFGVDPSAPVPTQAQTFGLPIELAADYSLLPFGLAKGAVTGASKLLGKGAMATGKAATQAAVIAEKGLVGTAAIEKTVGAAEATAKGIRNTANMAYDMISSKLNPKVAPDFNELAKIAKRNGIKVESLPEAIEFGKSSTISRMARASGAGPLGEARLANYENSVSDINNALKVEIARIGKGAPLNKSDAGKFIKEKYNEAVDNFFQDLGTSYRQVAAENPNIVLDAPAQDLLLNRLADVETLAKGMISRQTDPFFTSQGRRLIQNIDAVTKTGGKLENVVPVLQEIGTLAYKTKGFQERIPRDVQKLREIYRSINEALIGTLERTVGPQKAADLVESNKILTEFLGDKSLIGGAIQRTKSDEGLFESLVLNGNTETAASLKALLGKENLSPLKSTYLNELLKLREGDSAKFGTALNRFRDEKDIMSVLFDPKELDNTIDIIKLGDRLGSPVLSSSETGAATLFAKILEGIQSGGTNEIILENLKAKARGKLPPLPTSPQSSQLPPLPTLIPKGATAPSRLVPQSSTRFGPIQTRALLTEKTSQMLREKDRRK